MTRARYNADTPLGYAARLASYISDPSTIRVRTLDEWGRAPSIDQCANLRKKAEQEKRKHKEICEKRATPLKIYKTDGDFPCGHERSEENTYYTGNKEACRTCQREAQAVILGEIERQRERERAAEEHRKALADFAPPEPPLLLSGRERILARAVELTGISAADITGKRRLRPIVRVRFAAIYALRSLDLSYQQIARIIGMKDHTSVIHALEQVEHRRKREPDFDNLCLALEPPQCRAPSLFQPRS